MLRRHEGELVSAWADEIYRETRTELPALLSYRQLIEPIPDFLDQLGQILDQRTGSVEVSETVRPLRFHLQVRFQHGCLIDEVARELFIFRKVLDGFLWQRGFNAGLMDMWELRRVLSLTHSFVDEMIAQTIAVYAINLRPPINIRGLARFRFGRQS